MIEHKQRIHGYDLARAIAVFIMIVVNFNLVLASPDHDESVLASMLQFLQGKGAALFVVLAGVGISLLIKKNLLTADSIGLKQKRMLLYKRAAFLFVFGLFFSWMWPADILHFYGCYILIGAIVMTRHSAYLWILALLLIILYPYMLYIIEYEEGWNWVTVEYTDFWSISGFFRNFFINGFHPVVPWVAFLLAGIWLGRQNMSSKPRRNLILWVSVTIFILVQMISKRLIDASLSYTNFSLDETVALYGTSPMPPMPLFMISGISGSFVLIILCIWITEIANKTHQLHFLIKTGQMAFTHYITHIVLGIVAVTLFFGENNLPPVQALLLALTFCVASTIFSHLWGKKFKKGPMAKAIRFITKT
ncbi:DUF418 domain-containing protein [Aquimarina sp. MMG016]|uniref:DUF418 domain-containing protein n=1 Tax=Aquimarina sp. MMG016 TaxID=2822690 RepID=UPI001B3A67A7|nr:DUF418 domain-containing protein [Aquimarina sp. MMG016]MBQ4819323.1 DUF418 domain-containing protein [Aquimarina sp. MMG016]